MLFRCQVLLWLAAAFLVASNPAVAASAARNGTNNGYTEDVTWDNGSLYVKGERTMIMSGEFHYPRLPNPELWLDVFQKFKANGMNTVSIYFFWSYHSPVKGVFDFKTPPKDLQRLFDAAKKAGLWVIARPGPYTNAESNAGGLALWTTDGTGGKYRTSDDTYRQAWEPWVREIGDIIARNQVTRGGPVILTQVENELTETRYEANNTLVLYMEQIKKSFRDAGIIVPLTHNEKGMRGMSWSTDYNNVGGAVDIYGLDSYAGGLVCKDPDAGFNTVRTYHQWFQNYSFTQPELIPEFKGGWFEPWGGNNYDECVSEHNPEYPDVFYKDLIGQRVTLLNLYMTFGGTNWGHFAAPVVYTSYDYSASLRETREIQTKFQQYRLIALFTRVSQGLHNTYMVNNGTGHAVDSTAIWTWEIRNRDTQAGFYVTQHNSVRSRNIDTFTVFANTSAGPVSIPNVQLAGRQSKIIVTDYPVGKETLLYSSAEVLTYAISDVPAIAFYLRPGQVGEFAFKSAAANLKFETFGVKSDFAAVKSNSSSYTRFVYTQQKGVSVVKFSNGVTAYLLDTQAAFNFFAPATTSNPLVKADQHIFALGPYLVRTARVAGHGVELTGDTSNTTTIEVFAGANKDLKTITWNGRRLDTKRTAYGALQATVSGAEDAEIKLPTLTRWLSADSLPEKAREYNDSRWTTADKTSTLVSAKPATLPVLYSSDYGFYTGIKIYRARFDRPATGANITVNGGASAGWSAWLNGQFIGGHLGNASLATTNVLLRFSNATSLLDRDNVLTIVTDYTGHDQTSVGPAGGQNPRGILAATLLSPNGTSSSSFFTSWKIQGNAGGAAGAYALDPLRAPMNEGGLFAERLGWHLTSSPDKLSLPSSSSSSISKTKWTTDSPSKGLSKAGIAYYTTTFTITLPPDIDTPLAIELPAPTPNNPPCRAQLFVNGWQMGHYVSHIGPQFRFPIPPGIMDTRGGVNTLGITVWAQSEEGVRLGEVRVVSFGGKYRSGYEGGFGSVKWQERWNDEAGGRRRLEDRQRYM